MFHKIARIKPLPGFLLWVEFRNGAERIYLASGLPGKYPPFKLLLASTELFDTVKVDNGGYGVSWNDDLDLSAEELWTNGISVKEPFCPEPGSRCPTCGQMIRRKSPAQAEASRANLAKRTRKGGRPINPDSQRQKKLARLTGKQSLA